jgi:hypothetical protein
VVLAVVLVLPLGATGCMFEGPRYNVSVRNQTERTLTIYYDNPNTSGAASPAEQDERNTLAVLAPGQNTNFNIPGSRDCALVPVQAIDEEGVIVDSLPEGTCHDDDYVRWTITDDE